jgi:hypothetical protein
VGGFSLHFFFFILADEKVKPIASNATKKAVKQIERWREVQQDDEPIDAEAEKEESLEPVNLSDEALRQVGFGIKTNSLPCINLLWCYRFVFVFFFCILIFYGAAVTFTRRDKRKTYRSEPDGLSSLRKTI